MKRDYSKTDFTIEDCDVEGFVRHFNLEEEAGTPYTVADSLILSFS